MADHDTDLSPDERAELGGDIENRDNLTVLMGYVQPGETDDTIRLYQSASAEDYITIPRANVVERRRLGEGLQGSILWVSDIARTEWIASDETKAQIATIRGQLVDAVEAGEVSGYELADDDVEGFSGPCAAPITMASFAAGAAAGLAVSGIAGYWIGVFDERQSVEADKKAVETAKTATTKKAR